MSKVVYLYNAKNRMHEFLGTENVDDNAVLTEGQTLVAPQTANAYWDGQNWVDNTGLITIYHYDSDGSLDNLEIATKDAVLNSNETTIKPSDENGLGMYKPKFDKSQNKWVETLSKEEIDKLKGLEKTESSYESTVAVLIAQLLQTQMTVKQQGAQIASLTSALLANAKAKANN